MSPQTAADLELAPDELLRTVDVAELPFETTADVSPRSGSVAQDRAVEAVDFGVGMRFPGYNIYALGSAQTDKRALVMERLSQLAATQDAPGDWCYVQNFEDPARPLCLELGAGTGRTFRHRMLEFVSAVRAMVPAALTSEDYRRESQTLASALQERQSHDAAELESQARELGLTMLPTPSGFTFAPLSDGKVMEQEAFLALDDAERQRVQESLQLMTSRLIERLRDYPQVEQQLAQRQRELLRKTAEHVIAGQLAQVRKHYQTNVPLMMYLASAQRELVEHVDRLVQPDSARASPFLPAVDPEVFFARFNVNLIVDSSTSSGAPVSYESNPSLDNLLGHAEHRMEAGTPVTDFNLIRAGALHRANGGYLLLDAERVIQKPFAWEALKRAIGDASIRIESVSQLMNLTYSVSLEPEAIPLDVKVVLLGSRRVYHVLREYDPDFDDLFKVVADFDDDVDFDESGINAYAELIAQTVADVGIRHLDAGAVGRVLEHSSRTVEDRQRLSTHVCDIRDLLREADFVAANAEADLIRREHVAAAIDKRTYRLDRFREMVRENIARGLVVVDTDGARTGQINGLSVINVGHVQFGQPLRITATARLGRGELIDIERESHLGGRIHSKAVMIVSSFLGSRYAREHPLSLQASLVFEQSYGGVEGDSASIAEVCALISAIIDRPIKQSLAVTGSMDQHGTVQAIGGVNEKIEGFYDICAAQTLTGRQGVIVPATNRPHLMLRQDVVDAVAAGRFHVYAMATVDDAMALLFAAEDETVADPALIDEAVRSRLVELHRIGRRAARAGSHESEPDDGEADDLEYADDPGDADDSGGVS